MDDVYIEVLESPTVEDGDPRIKYERTYVLLPGKNVLSKADFIRVLGLLSNQIYDNQWTFGFSADDAGIGRLDVRKVLVVSLHANDWNKQELLDFYATHYPGVTVEFYDFAQASHFPVGTDQYPPKDWYVPTTQLFTNIHFGMDLNLDISPWGDVERGFPIYSVLDGTVFFTTDDWSGVGMCIIEHELDGETFFVQYAHVDLEVSIGQNVVAGEIIGRIANWTRGDGGDHLHFGVSTQLVTTEYANWGYWIDPVEWLKRFISAELVDASIKKETIPVEPGPGEIPAVSYELRSNNLIGMHSGYQKTGWDDYLVNARPVPQKVFSLGFAIEAKRLAPDALVVYRRYTGDGLDPDVKAQAKYLVDLYTEEVEVTARNMGLTEEQVLAYVDVFEGKNEIVPTFNAQEIHRAVTSDWWFSEYLYQRFGNLVVPGLLTVAIGNPHESEVELLLPVVEQVVKYHGYVGYHSYWTANRDRSYLTEHWKYHAGRWTEWDKVFTQHDLYPRYYFGEGGIVYAHDGVSFNSGRGWKSCGDIEDYIRDLDTFNTLVLEWNLVHNNRASGLTVFGFGNWGWDNFEIGEGDLKLIEAHFKEV